MIAHVDGGSARPRGECTPVRRRHCERRIAPAVVGARTLATLAWGPVATAFAYWAMVELGRRIPASTLSVALLATPSLGLTISSLVQRERIDTPLLAGIVLVAAGIRLATRAR